MDIFISWSGPRSGACAVALKSWLPCVIQSLKPWCSSEDIAKGARGGLEIAKKLGAVNFGIVCLTPGNLHNEWIHFESGALSKNLDESALFTLLIELHPSDVKPPLGHFQHTKCTKEDVLKLVEAINEKLSTPLAKQLLTSSFDAFWPQLEDQLKSLPTEIEPAPTARPDREILEEILSAVRSSQTTKTVEKPDVIERRARDIGLYSQGVLLGRKADAKTSVAVRNDDFVIRFKQGNDVYAIDIPTSVTWEAAKEAVANFIKSFTITDDEIPF